jgi:16S rRNA (guanine966-N2)-methyltransferase
MVKKPVCKYSSSAMLNTVSKTPKKTGLSSLRIIAGSLRGRRVQFSISGIRPTGDRVRETLFNWLGARVLGCNCLDLFAGSGALGLEALSRGAKSVLFVEKQSKAAAQIEQNLHDFACGGGTVLRSDAHRLHFKSLGLFDLVLLDPPFDSPGLANLCKLLEESGALANDALIYVEVASRSGLPELPAAWTALRQKTAGQVSFALLQRTDSDQ